MSAATVTLPRPRDAAFGLGWSAAAQAAGTVVKIGSTLVLTRLLAPDAYAVLGTALVVLTTLEWLSDTGVAPALVRHPHGGEPHWLLVGWWINLGRGAGLALAALLAAGPLAAFYDRPDLAAVVAVLALRPVLAALRSPGVPLLRRRLEYRVLFADEMAQLVAGAATSVGVAWLVPGAGAWALVAGTLAAALVGVAVSYRLAPVRPRWHWDRAVAGELAGFGGAVFVNTLVMAAWLNLDRLLGLKLLPVEAAGCYVVAWNLAAAAEAVVTRGTDVYFGLLARRPAETRTAWHARTAARAVLVAGPVLGVGVVAPAAVWLLYDARYQAAGVVFAVLLARLVVRAAGQLDFQFLLAAGRVRAGTVGYVAAAVAQAPLLVYLAAEYGAVGVAAAGLASTVVLAVVQAVAARELGRGGVGRTAAAAAAWAAVGLGGAVGVGRLLAR